MTKAEKYRLGRLSQMPCIACGRRPVECHHLVDRGYRRLSGGHLATIPLCLWHHRGVPVGQWTEDEMRLVVGPSLALSKRAFIARYGSERQLLDKVNLLLEEMVT